MERNQCSATEFDSGERCHRAAGHDGDHASMRYGWPNARRCQFGFAPNAMLDYETQCTLRAGHDGEHKLSRNVETSSEPT